MEVIFVPMTCPICQRRSAIPFTKAALNRKLQAGEPIKIPCGYGDESWYASMHDRALMLKLSREDDAVRQMARMPWPDTSWVSAV